MNRLSDLKRMIFLLLAGILSACSHDELTETRPAENGEPLVLTAVMADATTGTRATPDNSWTGTETIIVEVIDDYDDTTAPDWTQAKRGIYTAGTDGKLTFVSGEQSSWLSDNETKLVRAWHYGDNSNEHPDSWSVQSDQRTGDDYAKSDLLFAQETVSERQEIALNFYHQVAKVVVHVRNVGPVYGSSNVSVTIGEFPSFDIVMNGTVSTDNMNGNYLNWTPGDKGYITPHSLGPQSLASNEIETSLASFAALVIPQTVDAYGYLLVIWEGVVSYRYHSPTDIIWKAGNSYTYDVTVTKESRVQVNNITVSPWTPQDGGSLETE